MARRSRLKKKTDEGLYSIQAVARRTGVSVEVLRAWERRYAVVEPTRSDGGHRLYSAADIEHLSLLRRAVDRGLRIGDAGRLTDGALRGFLAEPVLDAEPTARSTAAPAAAHGTETAHLAACQASVEAFDSAGLARSLARAKVDLSTRTWIDAVVTPLLVWIGERWSNGALCVAQEHMASTVLRSSLLTSLSATPATANAPCVVVTTPALELHEIGALLAALAAASAGWRVEYLGPNLPAAEIAVAVRRMHADAVALSLARPVRVPAVEAELKELRKGLPRNVVLFVGGSGAGAYAATIEATRALRFDDCWSFALHLESKGGHAS